jgi:hypothetical protein
MRLFGAPTEPGTTKPGMTRQVFSCIFLDLVVLGLGVLASVGVPITPLKVFSCIKVHSVMAASLRGTASAVLVRLRPAQPGPAAAHLLKVGYHQ